MLAHEQHLHIIPLVTLVIIAGNSMYGLEVPTMLRKCRHYPMDCGRWALAASCLRIVHNSNIAARQRTEEIGHTSYVTYTYFSTSLLSQEVLILFLSQMDRK